MQEEEKLQSRACLQQPSQRCRDGHMTVTVSDNKRREGSNKEGGKY